MKHPDLIDAVITWVDGDSDGHQKIRNIHLKNLGRFAFGYDPAGMSSTRFKNNGEIKYCVHSIRKFLPWIRNIYIVTNGQIPDFFSKDEIHQLGIKYIDHETIFRGFEWALPTFNSVSIENMLYRIPGLAEKYIYFNDDFIAISKISESDFFSNGKVVLRGKWMPLERYGVVRSTISGIANVIYRKLSLRERSLHILRQYRAAHLAGLEKRYIQAPHTPYPIITKTLSDFFNKKENMDAMRSNIKYKFRNLNQFVCHPLAISLEVIRGNYELCEKDDYLTISFTNNLKETIRKDMDKIASGRYKFLCLQNLERAEDEIGEEIKTILDSIIFKNPPKEANDPHHELYK